ncbi:cobalt-precorrin-5B (C(1))-methyltransferase [Bacillus sp. V3B]|uniref:cobalt-precorrin-5B (C(1))-methyltransferase n=1 Tax=Bacillus sp. V3B TaxID=2804915 RepID=UPI00210D16BA|nr:cobalt-precorrin-5B (C(1))-methyltransferase [Bacillus sp. V3B]MCQ6274250.1 cobalt-precorrin-5B (C(1))-methyltransferase [Bacillus sp. V3B]
MRSGYTTGANATAATKAALTALITKEVQTEATIFLPVGRYVSFTIESCDIYSDSVTTSTIKDGGDDPDATHGAAIMATVSWRDKPDIFIDGGVGVGRVTKPGLPIEVGQAAINPVPRKMIRETAIEVLNEFDIDKGVNIVISVPKGEEIAKKTMNGRLGIIGGISILGTRGIVVPFSTAAYKASIVYGIQVARASGCDHVVITTGGRSEKYGMAQYTELLEEAFIEMGDFIGFTLKECKRLGVKRVSIVGMMGKLSKLAKGDMMVHSKGSSVDFQFLVEVAEFIGVDDGFLEEIRHANTATQVGEMMTENGYYSFFERLCQLCCQESVKEVKGGLTIDVSLYTLKGKLLGKASVNDEKQH